MQEQEKIESNADNDDEPFKDFDLHNYGCFAGEEDDDFDYETDHDIGN